MLELRGKKKHPRCFPRTRTKTQLEVEHAAPPSGGRAASARPPRGPVNAVQALQFELSNLSPADLQLAQNSLMVAVAQDAFKAPESLERDDFLCRGIVGAHSALYVSRTLNPCDRGENM